MPWVVGKHYGLYGVLERDVGWTVPLVRGRGDASQRSESGVDLVGSPLARAITAIIVTGSLEKEVSSGLRDALSGLDVLTTNCAVERTILERMKEFLRMASRDNS